MNEAENGRFTRILNRRYGGVVLSFSNFGKMAGFHFLSKRLTLFCLSCVLFSMLGSAIRAQDEPADDPVAVFNQAQDLHEKGDLEGAVKLYEKALKIEPAFPEAEYQMGMAELARDRKAAAEKAFRRAIALREDWTLPMTSLGSLLMDRGEIGEAERLFSRSVTLEPQNAVALSALTELKVSGKAPAAELEPLLSKITNLTGRANANAALWTAKAAIENALGRRSAAKLSLSKALSMDKGYRSAIFLLGEIALTEGDLDNAREMAGRVSQPPSDRGKMLTASILSAEGKTDEALKILDSLAAPGKNAADLRSRLTAARKTSTADLERSLESAPHDAAVLGRLCVLFRRDDPQKALVYCRRASEAEPENIAHAVGFGAALVQAKQYEGAAQLFKKLLQIAPDNATARANLASALFQLKRYSEAKAEFQWLTEAQPRSAGAYLFLGIIHDELGEHMDAMANYQQYLRLADPESNKLDIEKVNLRLPLLQKLINSKKK